MSEFQQQDEVIDILLRRAMSGVGDPHLKSLPYADEPYYAFLFHLAAMIQPKVIVELGVYQGVGLAHLAAGCPTAKVIGVDKVKCEWEAAISPYSNVRVLVQDSIEFLLGYDRTEPIDILHIDTDHTYLQVKAEFYTALPLMPSFGFICLDDIGISDEMRRFWTEIRQKKFSLPQLHVTGYGVVIV